MHAGRVLLILLVVAGLVCTGCARRVPLGELGASGAEVGIRVVLTDGEELSGRLLSVTGGTFSIEASYNVADPLELRGYGENRRLVRAGEPVPGELVAVERDGMRRVARVRRDIPAEQVASATFHRSRNEASTARLLSHTLGPIVGALLALLI